MSNIGSVKMINKDRGYGFIRRESAPDLFFHVTECANKQAFESLVIGDEVSYEVGQGKKGEEGRNITQVI